MANVRAFRSGLWSDTTTSSPWWTGTQLVTANSLDDVHPNGFLIHIDTNVTVKSLMNDSGSRVWKDGPSANPTTGGRFNLYNNTTTSATLSAFSNTDMSVVVLTGTNSATLNGVLYGSVGSQNLITIDNQGSGTLTINGSLIGRSGTSSSHMVARNSGNGTINFSGTITGGTSTNARCLENTSTGTLIVNANITAGTGSAAYGINNVANGKTFISGNITATSVTHAFVSSNLNADNKISANIINHSSGCAAIFAAKYVIDPIPTNSRIVFPSSAFYTIDVLVPSPNKVRGGTSYLNGSLIGTCVIPDPKSVNLSVPVDNKLGTAYIDPKAIFTTNVSSLTSEGSIGQRLKNSATVQSVGNILASFSK